MSNVPITFRARARVCVSDTAWYLRIIAGGIIDVSWKLAVARVVQFWETFSVPAVVINCKIIITIITN